MKPDFYWVTLVLSDRDLQDRFIIWEELMKLKHFALATAALVGTAGTAFADCPTSGRISIVGNEFPAIQTVGEGAVACGGGAVEAKSNLTADHQKINVAGMSGNPAEYTTASSPIPRSLR